MPNMLKYRSPESDACRNLPEPLLVGAKAGMRSQASNKQNGTVVLRPDIHNRTRKRWGRAVRLALNELVRCQGEACKQAERIDAVLSKVETAFRELQRDVSTAPTRGGSTLVRGQNVWSRG